MKETVIFECKDKSVIGSIINMCDILLNAGDVLTVHGYGKDRDLALRIIKDNDFERKSEPEESSYNLVMIHTFIELDDGVNTPIDDVLDTHVTDGSLRRELLRILDKQDLSLADLLERI